ncbi:MAG: mechanosensitive ion channel family protein [Sphingomonadales bacterium]|nr:mechanosensitive ion channel [Sphingomonadales bacterium]
MNSFWHQEWGDNSIQAYTVVGLVIVLVWLFRRYLSSLLAGWLFRWLGRVLNTVERDQFNALVIAPLERFVLVLVLTLALYRLQFPSALNIDIYRFEARDIVHAIGKLLFIATLTSLLLRAIDFAAILLEKRASRTPDLSDNQLIVFFKDFFKVILVINAVLLVLSFVFGFNIGSLVTGLSIVGAAIALALRESLENLIASFIIFFDKPFITGDLVKVNAITGTVEKIGLRSTRIRTEQKTFVTVPNKQMVDSILDNLSLRSQRRADIKLELSAKATPAQLETLLAEIRTLLKDPAIEQFSVLLSDIRSGAVCVEADYYTAPLPLDDFNRLREKINMQVLTLVHQLQLEWPADGRPLK